MGLIGVVAGGLCRGGWANFVKVEPIFESSVTVVALIAVGSGGCIAVGGRAATAVGGAAM